MFLRGRGMGACHSTSAVAWPGAESPADSTASATAVHASYPARTRSSNVAAAEANGPPCMRAVTSTRRSPVTAPSRMPAEFDVEKDAYFMGNREYTSAPSRWLELGGRCERIAGTRLVRERRL